MPSPFRKLSSAILVTGLVAGTMDITAAVIQFVIKTGKAPEVVFRYIASAVFGTSAFTDSGLAMPLAGLLFHFMIAFIFTILFYFIFSRPAWVRENAIVAGILYGIFAWAVMNLFVVPLTRAPAAPFAWKNAWPAMLILICCIGLPISLMTKKYYLYKK